MTNTINNVPRELTIERDVFGAMHIKLGDFDFIQIQYQYPYTDNASTKTLAERIAALLSDPSPAGVDGLEVVVLWYADDDLGRAVDYGKIADGEGLCRLSDAEAIIDGLRGEVGAQRVKTCTALKERNDAREERDHLAQCLKFARTTMAVVANNANLRGVEYRSLVTEVKRIDAALSAVCAAAPNIATTSEHSGS